LKEVGLEKSSIHIWDIIHIYYTEKPEFLDTHARKPIEFVTLQDTTLVVLALSLTASEDLLAGEVAHTFEQAALAELPRYAFVYAILDGIDVLVAGDLGLVEVVWVGNVSQREVGCQQIQEGTFGRVASLVLTKPSEVFVLNPWHPVLILFVVGLLCPLHFGGVM